MRMLSFKGFLEAYLRHLSGQESLALSCLAPLASTQKRLVEPLVLWAVTTEKTGTLSKHFAGQPKLLAELHQLATLADAGLLEAALSTGDSTLRSEYLKVWRSYVVRREAHSRDERLKLEARRRVLALEASGQVTRYRMAKDLGLNQGNLFAFLKQGNPKKLSLDRAYELVEYLEAAGDSCRGKTGRASFA